MNTLKRIAAVIITFTLSTCIFATEQTAAGMVISTSGVVEATDAKNVIHVLGRRSSFYSQETIITKANSKAKLRFTDGSVVSLSPLTEFKVNDYVYNPKRAAVNTYSAELLKGAMLSVSGAIAKLNPEKIEVKTQEGTIGILGTTYFIDLQSDPKTGDKELTVTHIDSAHEKGVFVTLPDGKQVDVPFEHSVNFKKSKCESEEKISNDSNKEQSATCETKITVKPVTHAEIQQQLEEAGVENILPADSSADDSIDILTINSDLNNSLTETGLDELNQTMEQDAYNNQEAATVGICTP